MVVRDPVLKRILWMNNFEIVCMPVDKKGLMQNLCTELLVDSRSGIGR
jgi:hypothetical protein